jgi:hypothetical protein
MQNILGALLLIIASSVAYSGQIRIYNFSDKSMKIILVYKNNHRNTSIIEPINPNDPYRKKQPKLFTTTTQANPLKTIIYSYIGDNKTWISPINFTKNTNNQIIQMYYPMYIECYNYNVNQNDLYLETGRESLIAQEYKEDV